MKKIFFAFILFSLMSYSYAQKEENFQYSNSILQRFTDDYLSKYKDIEYISAVAATLQCQDKTGKNIESAYSGKLGFGNNLIENQKLKKEDVFQIGSITKSFISVVLLQLEEEKRYNFSIEDTVGKWFPEQKYQKWKNIKIRQLLNMTSGIPNYTNDFQFLNYIKSNPYKYNSLDNVLDYVNNQKLNFTPGTKYEYSNTNYTLAGLLIMRITNHSFESEVKERIINRLNLKHTFFPKNFAVENYPYYKLVHGYYYARTFFPEKTDITNFSLSWANSAGAINSNTSDVNTYVNALFSSGKILSNSQIEKLKTGEAGIFVEDDDNFSSIFGLGVIKYSNKKTNETFYSYTGGTLGFRFVYFYYPIHSLNIVFALNSAYDGENNINSFIMDKIVPEIWKVKCF